MSLKFSTEFRGVCTTEDVFGAHLLQAGEPAVLVNQPYDGRGPGTIIIGARRDLAVFPEYGTTTSKPETCRVRRLRPGESVILKRKDG